MIITSAQVLGGRPSQEDRYCTYVDGYRVFLAVFDGHGGTQTVDTLRKELPEVIARYNGRFPLDHMKTIFSTLDERTKDFEDGSTASIVMITPEEVIAAVLGDSPIELIVDGVLNTLPEHNVRSNSKEHYDALSRGGLVYGGYLYDPETQNSKGLQMSRTFGDTLLRRVTSHEPEIFQFNRDSVKSILVASDGLTDPAHMTSSSRLTKHSTAQELVDNHKYSPDNVTAIVAHLGGQR